MSGLLVGVAVLMAAVLQVSLAPLFPISGATFEFLPLVLLLTARLKGPRLAMIALPFGAICTAFLIDRSPALLILAYVPLLPLLYAVDEYGPPLGTTGRTILAAVLAGAWLRVVLALGAVAGGASLEPGALAGAVLLPGMFLDAALTATIYAPVRFVAWEPRSMSLSRRGYAAYEHS
jgi:hypothetical protein